MPNIRHVLGISGGKDSTALAIYLKQLYPKLDIEYYFCDTGKELDETYELMKNLEVFLGKKIEFLNEVKNDTPPFEHFLKLNGGYLPSASARWCTTKMKLVPFENFIGNDLAVSYVGIRGDEDREGYVSTKPNIQTVFPFRQNIWSKEMINSLLQNKNILFLQNAYQSVLSGQKLVQVLEVAETPLSVRFGQATKLNALLSIDTQAFNKVMFAYLQTIDSVIGKLDSFPLVQNEDNLNKEDIFKILKDSGVGLPKYYTELEYEIDGKKGIYNRSRSGCFFCFFQQKIEWIWLYEQHPDKFWESVSYEKQGYTWIQGERLEDLIQPERMAQIKREHLKRTELKLKNNKSNRLMDIMNDENEACLACFV